MIAAPFVTAPVEIDQHLESMIAQLQDLDETLDSLVELRSLASEWGMPDQFGEVLDSLGFSEEAIAQFTDTQSQLQNCFSQ